MYTYLRRAGYRNYELTTCCFRASSTRVPEGEGEPAHVASVATLPEVDDALEVVLGAVVVVAAVAFLRVDRHPVATEEDVAVAAVEVTCHNTPPT